MSAEKARPTILAITACPTGIAHTYMAAENLEQAGRELGYEVRVETHGSVGVEHGFTAQEIAAADALVVAADKQIDLSRFTGIPTVRTGVDEGIRRPQELLEKALRSPALKSEEGSRRATDDGSGDVEGKEGFGTTVYKALMNGVSHMIPFVVTGGLLIAIALSIGGQPGPEGIAVPEGTFWYTINQIGSLAFTLMVPILSGYIAMAIADRPGLAPGMVTGYIAITGSLYGSQAGAGFLGGIVTGFASGYLALAIKKIPVHQYVRPIMPIIVIPILTTFIVGTLFVYLLGAPIAHLFEFLTQWLGSMQGTSVIVLGAILGAMSGFDMGGPVNKTAFLFSGGLIATGNSHPMGMMAAAIAVPPLGMGLATLLRRSWFTPQENNSGIAALFMGFFGITEGAIPFAAARPLQMIPANVVGGAVAGGLAGLFGAQDHVMHGGPIVAVLGAVDHVFGYFVAMIAGTVVTALVALGLMAVQRRRTGVQNENGNAPVPAAPQAASASDGTATTTSVPQAPAVEPAAGGTSAAGVKTEDPDTVPASSGRAATITAPITDYLRTGNILLDQPAAGRDELIRRLATLGAASGQISDVEAVVAAALAREAQGTTAAGQGIAIPHAKTDAVATPFLGFARVPEGVDWQAPDGKPATLVFLIGVPEAAAGDEHLRILAALSRALMKKPVRAALEAAETPADAQRVLAEAIG